MIPDIRNSPPLPLNNESNSPYSVEESKEDQTLVVQTARHPMATVVDSYLASLRNIGQTVRIVMPHLAKWLVDELKKHEKKLHHYLPLASNPGERHEITLESARDFVEFTTTLRELEELQANRAPSVLARSLFMQMFCEFDAFMGDLLKAIYLRNSELLKGISREISLADLLEYEDIEAVKMAMLDKEIETFRRDSYVDQFAQLEKKFGITLRKFSEWGQFVELSQRRNLFTHNDGMVNDQYLSVCGRECHSFQERPKIGQTLKVDGEYIGHALLIMSKVGFMLCHTLWSKVFPREHVDLHTSLNDNLYTCLEQKKWKTAAELGDFALSEPMRKNVSEINYRLRVVNVAIALKFSMQEDAAKKLLHSLDWSASYRDFKLALCVLEDKFDEAIDIMESIGKTGELLRQHSYFSWPLFHKFRERPEFYSTYEKIYGEPYLANVPNDGKTTSVSLAAIVSPLRERTVTGSRRSSGRTSKAVEGSNSARSVAKAKRNISNDRP